MDKLCFKCLKQKDNITTYVLKDRGYGSEFDNLDTKLQLCQDCLEGKHEELEKWFSEKCKLDKNEFYFEIYKYENELKKFIDSLEIEGQELFYNTFEKNHVTVDREDWIKSVSASFFICKS